MVGCLQPGVRDDLSDEIKRLERILQQGVNLADSLVREGLLSSVVADQQKRNAKSEVEVLGEIEKIVKAAPTCPKIA